MSQSILDAAQRAVLREALLAQRRQIVHEINVLHGGGSRLEHARDDLPQRDADREVDLARTDQLARGIWAIEAALERIERDDYGRCSDCGVAIPFERLSANPQAVQCVACEAAFEARHGGTRPRASY